MAALTDLDPLAVALAAENITLAIQSEIPDIDLGRGTAGDLLIHVHAILSELIRLPLEEQIASLSVLRVAGAIDAPERIAHVLSNFGAATGAVPPAIGKIRILRNADSNAVIARGSSFSTGAIVLVAADTVALTKYPELLRTASDVAIVARPDGLFESVIDAALALGSAGSSVGVGTVLTANNPPIGFVRAEVASSFGAPADRSTTADVLARLRHGLAARTFSSIANCGASLLDVPGLTAGTSVSVFSGQEPGMLRNRRGLYAASGSGRVDWYLRQTAPLEVVDYRASTADAGVVEGSTRRTFRMHRDIAAGMYEIREIRRVGTPATTSPCRIVSEERAIDVEIPRGPDIRSLAELAYSRWQSPFVTFDDPAPPSSSYPTSGPADYDVTFVRCGDVALVQDYVCAESRRPLVGDILVRAAIPCFVTLSVAVAQGDALADRTALQSVLSRAVDATMPARALYAGQLHAAAAAVLPTGAWLASIDMVGRVRYPDGTTGRVRGSDALVAPEDPEKSAAYGAIKYFCLPSDISIRILPQGSQTT